MTQNNAYSSALAELIGRRDALRKEANELSDVIDRLTNLAGGSVSVKATPQAAKATVGGAFSKISLHWGCIWLLTEFEGQGLTTAQVAQKLVERGRTSTAYSFASTVSAVLSNMKSRDGEADQVGNVWHITPSGKAKWLAIESRARALAQ